jgi:hypothetical protein
MLQALSNLATDYTDTINGLFNSLFGSGTRTLVTNLYNAIKVPASPRDSTTSVC